MTTLTEQLELEKTMVDFGISRYQEMIQDARNSNREFETGYGQKLIREYVLPISTLISEYCKSNKPGVCGAARGLLSQIKPETAAYFGLRGVMGSFIKPQKLLAVAVNIGAMIEDDLKFSLFEKEQTKYFKAILKDFERKGSKGYHRMSAVLSAKARDYDVRWNSWTQEEKAHVGSRVIDAIMQATDLITISGTGAQPKRIVASADTLSWINKYVSNCEILHPAHLPCIIPPVDWTSIRDGGYHGLSMRFRTPLVKTRSKEHKEMFTGDISSISAPINKLQNTGWRINRPILDLIQQCWEQGISIGLPKSTPTEIPLAPVPRDLKFVDMTEEQKEMFLGWKREARNIYNVEGQRVSRCLGVSQTLRLANLYSKYSAFWYVYQCDFRGRVYTAATGLSPQGPDFSKALLEFSRGKELGQRGLYWLKVHLANCYGIDKVSFADRLKWVNAHEDQIFEVAKNPLDNRDFWASADQPWQFIAAAMELEKALESGEGAGFISHLPVSLDGTCNGLQQYSALLRDEIGGRETNLLPSERPNDIYSSVARVTTGLLKNMAEDYYSINWTTIVNQHGGILPRSLVKRVVMTLPYGVTKHSCQDYLNDWLVNEAVGNPFPKESSFLAAGYLTPLVWEAIEQVVKAAIEGMGWLQGVAGQLAKESLPCVWWSYLGFPVRMDNRKVRSKKIFTHIGGRLQLRINEGLFQIDSKKQKLGIAPNFIHSLDACHLMLTIEQASLAGVSSFCAVHDSFGTHACDIDTLAKTLREAFVEMYSNYNALEEFKTTTEAAYGLVLPDLPKTKGLDINQVIDSKYFFA